MILGLFQPLFFLNILLFCLGFYFTVIIPGYLISNKLKQLQSVEQVFLAFPIGLMILAWQAYILRSIGFEWGGVILSIIGCGIAVLNHRIILTFFQQLFTSLRHIDRLAVLIVVLGGGMQLLTVMPSGFLQHDGVRYYQINAHDGMFHLSVIRNMIMEFPPQQPGASDLPLTNYHYWSDMIIAEIARVWHLSPNHLYFQSIPLLLVPLLAIGVYLVTRRWFDNKIAARFALFLHFFSGDISYVFMYLFHRVWAFAPVSIDNGVIQFINMPQAFVKLFFLAGLLGMLALVKKRSWFLGCVTMAMFATMTGLKIYFAISVALGLVCVMIYELLHVLVALIRKRNIAEALSECFFWTVQTATFALLALIIFLPTNKGSGGVYFVLSTWPKLLISPEKMNWNIWWLRMQVYEEAHNLKAIVVYQILVNLVFFITFYAWKGFGVFALLLKNYRNSRVMVSFSFFQIAVLVFLGMHTLQTSGGHNTFNFTIVALSWLTFLTAGVYGWVWQKVPRFIGILLTIVIVVMTIPRVFALTHEFVVGTWTQKKSVLITHAELEALSYIEANAPLDFVIQADGRNALNYETPYIYALTGRRTYLGGTLILESHNQPVAARKKLVNNLFSPLVPTILDQNISEQGIDLLYIKKNEEQTAFLTLEKITHDTHLLMKFFENEEIAVYVPTTETARSQFEWCGVKTSSAL